MSDARVVAVATVKGGSGKTTVAMCLAANWLYRGLATAVIDTDPQRSARRWAFAGSVLEIMRIDVCDPNDRDGVDRLVGELLDMGFDRVVIDTPGFRSGALTSALWRADLALVPMRPSPVDYEVAADTLDVIAEVAAARPPTRPLAVRLVMTQVTPRTVIARHMRDEVLRAGYPLLDAELAHRVHYAEAPFTGSVPGLIAPGSPAAVEVDALVAEIDAVLR